MIFSKVSLTDEKKDSSQLGKVVEATEIPNKTILSKAKLYEYRPPKFFADYAVTGFNNSAIAYQQISALWRRCRPIYLSNGNDFNGIIRLGHI